MYSNMSSRGLASFSARPRAKASRERGRRGALADFAYQFAWDAEKAAANRAKHGVAFELAATVFRDALALSLYDDDHSEEEERWITLGIAETGELLLVVHTFEELSPQEALIRIISAREPSRQERLDYQGR